MNIVRSNKISLKYQRFTQSGCKDKGVRIFVGVAKTQFPHECGIYFWFNIRFLSRKRHGLPHYLSEIVVKVYCFNRSLSTLKGHLKLRLHSLQNIRVQEQILKII